MEALSNFEKAKFLEINITAKLYQLGELSRAEVVKICLTDSEDMEFNPHPGIFHALEQANAPQPPNLWSRVI